MSLCLHNLFVFGFTLILVFVSAVYGKAPSCESTTLNLVCRDSWGARPPKRVTLMATPVDTVVIHHTYVPGKCGSLEACKAAMRAMQNYHMDTRGWDDIGYSFAIGLDRVFQGRGWDRRGAHAPPYNNRSIGIAFIGDYSKELPSDDMLCQGFQLIDYGVAQGHISPDYQLIGHRQARRTECPGDKFFAFVRTWPHWNPNPKQAKKKEKKLE